MRIAVLLVVCAGALGDVSGGSGRRPKQIPVQRGPQGKLAYYDSAARRWMVVEGAGRAWDGNEYAFFCDGKFFVWGAARPREGEIEYYDFKRKAWDKIEKPPLESRELFAVSINGPKFAIWDGDNCEGALYDFTKRKWERLPKAPIEERDFNGLAWVGRRIVVWGGCSKKFVRGRQLMTLNDGAVFDTGTKTWRKMSDSGLEGRYGALVIGVKNKVMVWGGYTNTGALRDGAMYDPESDTWEKLPEAPLEARYDVGGTVIGSKVYVFGGCGMNQDFKDAAVYDVSRRAWRRLPEMPISGRHCPVVAQAGTKIYVWGGRYQRNGGRGRTVFRPPRDAAVLDTRTETWEKIEDAPFDFFEWHPVSYR